MKENVRRKLVAMSLSVLVLMGTISMPMNVSVTELEYSTQGLVTSVENDIIPLWLAPVEHTQYPIIKAKMIRKLKSEKVNI